MGQTILVTGANGFVGRHLCEHLLALDHRVTAVVRRAGTAPAGTREVVVDDIGPTTEWSTVLAGADSVIHLAARVHVMKDRSSDPLADFRRVNTAGTEVLARAAFEAGVRRFVFVSSIKVNGEETTGAAFTAQDSPRPLDPYGQSKFDAEVALAAAAGNDPSRYVIVRSPLVFGPGVGGNFRRMMKFVSAGLPLPLGSVKNSRSLVSVWNLVDLLARAAVEPAAGGATVLAGESVSLSTPELLKGIARAMGRPARLFPFPVGALALAGRAVGVGAEVHRLTSSLEVEAGSSSTSWHWSPKIGVDEGLERTARGFAQNNLTGTP